MLRKLVPYLGFSYVTFIGWTTRQKILRADIPLNIHKSGERFIYAFWHQRQVFFTWSHRDVDAAVLVSKSNDGELIAKTMELSGIGAVRGSSSRGGAIAAREMVEILRSGRDVGITPDGPRGPAREVKEGAVRVAQLAGMPIIPIANALSHKIEIAKAWKNEVGDSFLGKPEKEWLPGAIEIAIRENLKAIRSTLSMANISHDTFFSEASLHAAGKVTKLVEVYKARGVTYEAAEGKRREKGDKVRSEESKAAKFADRQLGGTFLMTATYQEHEKYLLKDEEDRIILRHDGTPVYLTADLAYHKEKFDRGYDLMVDVFGADHAGHVPRIQSGMTLLGLDSKQLQFVLVQMMRIVRGGEEVKVSKRKGTLFELSDLIDEAGPDVCRFIFLMKTANAQFDFDLDAVKAQSKENPVFYFQYGHARCASVLKKAVEKGVTFVGAEALTEAQLGKLVLPEEKAMLKKMSLLGDVVTGAAEKLEPHHVLYYCQELIADFHSYYTKYKSDPIVSADVEKTQGRLAMVAALKHTLASAFGILGIEAPEHMEAPPEED